MKRQALALGLGLLLIGTAAADPKTTSSAWARISKTQSMLEYFFMEAGFYPNSLEELEQLINSKAPKGSKLLVVPKDPATNQPFSYTLEKTGRRYILTVPDSSKYPEGKPYVQSMEWGFLADLAELRRFEQIVRHTTNIIKAVATQVELFAKDHGNQFPNSLDDLMPKYMARYPTDPLTNKNFNYTKTATGYIVACPNPERYGFKVFQYNSATGIELEQTKPTSGGNSQTISPVLKDPGRTLMAPEAKTLPAPAPKNP